MSDPARLLAHAVEGDGEPLLLLNGGMMTWAAWGPVKESLAADHRLILCDLRGQLLSPGAAPRDLAGNVGDLTTLLAHLEAGPVHVLGTSYGGQIGLLLAALAPERVRSLVCVTVADYATDTIWRGAEDLRVLVAEALAGGDRGRLHDRVVEEVYSSSYRQRYAMELAARREQVAALPDAWFAGLETILTAMEKLDLRPYLDRIRCPTLVVIAGRDTVIPPQRSLDLAAAIAGAEIQIHETSGHALVAEDPAWLAEVSMDFLVRHAVSPRDAVAAPDPTPD